MIAAFIVSDFSLITVYQNSHSLKPLFYKIAGTWGNHEGSLLLWITILVLFSYLGWDRVGYVAGEMKNPKEIIPRTMFYGISIIAIIYLGANLMYHTVMGLEGVRNSNIVASDTASILFGNFGAAIISMIVIISATGSINGTMMSASRLYYAMSKDKLLFIF